VRYERFRNCDERMDDETHSENMNPRDSAVPSATLTSGATKAAWEGQARKRAVVAVIEEMGGQAAFGKGTK